MRKSKVKWTAEEMLKLADAVAEARVLDPGPPLVQLINRAQEAVLPKERWRVVKSLKAFGSLVEAISIRLMEACTSDTPVVALEEPEIRYRDLDPQTALPQIKLEDLMAELGRRLAQALPAAASVAQQGDKPVTVAVSEPAKKDTRTRIAVVGFLPDQQKQLQSKASAMNLKLQFVSRASKLDLPLRAEYCIVERHVSHSMWDAAREKYGPDKVRFVQGISSALKELADINSKAVRA